MTTINPFYNPRSAYSRPTFNYEGAALFTHRGVSIYRNPAGSYDYVYEGVTITQRAGWSRDNAPGVINDILDGLSPVSSRVASHLRNHGHAGMTYEEYMQLWAAGKVA